MKNYSEFEVPLVYDASVNHHLRRNMQRSLEDLEKQQIIHPDIVKTYPLISKQGDEYGQMKVIEDPDFKARVITHPVMLEDDVVLVDKRPFQGRNGKVKSQTDWDLMRQRARIELAWVNDPEAFVPHAGFWVATFSGWVEAAVTNKLNLEPTDAAAIRIMAAVYATGMYWRQEYKEDALLSRLVTFIAKSTRLPGQTVMNVIEQYEEAILGLYQYQATQRDGGLRQLASALGKVVGEDMIQAITLVNILSNNAYISSAGPTLGATALESPSTFALLSVNSAVGGIQGRTALGRMAGFYFKRTNGEYAERFIHNFS